MSLPSTLPFAPAFSVPARARQAWLLWLVGVAGGWLSLGAPAAAQSSRAVKPLAAPKILSRHLTAVGGEKALRAAGSTTTRGVVQTDAGEAGSFTLDRSVPDQLRLELAFDADRWCLGVSGTSAWAQTTREGARTLVDEAGRQRALEGWILAGRLIDAKGQGLATRSLPVVERDGKPYYRVVFTSRERAEATGYFAADTGLLTRLESGEGANRRTFQFADYRLVNGIREPFQITLEAPDEPALTLTVTEVIRVGAFATNHFGIPSREPALDVSALLTRIVSNQRALDERVTQYTYTLLETIRRLDGDGRVKETEVKTYEVYPLKGGVRARKLVAVDGKPLSASEAEKEQRRVAKFIEENEARQEKRKASKADDDDEAQRRRLTIAQFLRVCEFYNPRRETLRERPVIVCDFRPRADYKPTNDAEKIIQKLVGTVWLDAEDEEVARLEGRFASDFKVGGGLLASLKRGAAFVFEQTRNAEGVWLPLREEFNAGIKVLLLAGLNISVENRYGDYRKFSTESEEATDDPPAEP
ncbi:hypothetical protein J8C06_11265 [Chloracidobacterium validum]|uniref:Uncharacterized protein n=1 Tax=Chloracidobacterium validum TaxID=2821543 RepID=A0ABX8BBR9_9BACT|nr:hypothetical protein [Chloracidobacterium validum]QUW04374.1 hypothetical protein J8C06_11265 [Chloracidobacterium validum]